MSEYIICKGKAQLSALGFSIADADDFLMRGAFWLGETYKLINCLIDNNICFAMWYSDYLEDLDLCNTRDEVLKTCYDQIMDESGMCEVYSVSNITEK